MSELSNKYYNKKQYKEQESVVMLNVVREIEVGAESMYFLSFQEHFLTVQLLFLTANTYITRN